MRIAVYGGSFNPPHVGHALVASWVRWTDLADEVWLLPAFAHPFAKDMAPFADRAAMCDVVAGVLGAGVGVSRVEADLQPPSYTIRTLEHLRVAHPEHTFQLVVGADVVPETPKWRDWDRIAAEFAPIVVGRAGWPDVAGAPSFPGISSTEIRRRAAAGEPFGHLVPATIAGDVARLYGPPPAVR